MVKAIILDLDGLISDTEKLHMKSYIEAFAKKDIVITEKTYKDWWIKKGLGVKDMLKKLNLDYDVEELRALKKEVYDQLLDTELEPMPYAIEFVKFFANKLPMAVASASMPENVEYVLNKFDLMKYMEFTLSFADVKNRKPDPEIWLIAAKKLGLEPKDCIAIEDAEKGVIAAFKANMPCIAIPNKYTDDHDFSKANYIVDSLMEAKDLILNLSSEF
ncbi:MAG: HAD family phosphatase [Tissierellia bacterium]|nr:HAD family phosphatase [Tissierellia bacterium]